MKTPEFWGRGAQEQTVIHPYTECRRWRRERRKPSRELGQHGISWQTRRREDGLAVCWQTSEQLGQY